MTCDKAMQTFNEMMRIKEQLRKAGYRVRKLPRRLVLSIYKPGSGHNAIVFSETQGWRASIADPRLEPLLNVNSLVGADK